jgi:hypothetical protein
MKRVLVFIGPWWPAVLALSIGLSSYSCGDSASISDVPQVPLSSLTVTPGTLQPSFSSNVSNYTVDAPTAATSVTVTAAPTDSTTTMTINGVPTAAGQGRSIPLGPPGSTTTITIALSSQIGAEGAYTVTVTRLLSSDNNLSALSVTPGRLVPSFTPSTTIYTVDVGTKVTTVTIAGTKSDANAVILIGSVPIPAGTASGQATIPLNGPGTTTPIPVEVTAPNGNKKAYSITVNRAAPSSNNNLSGLTVTPGTLSPAFDSNQLTYTMDVAFDIASVLVTATKADADAVISGDLPNEGRATIPLDGPGTSKTISIIVTAPNGSSKAYRITVNRAAPSSNNNLSALTVTPGTLSPAFDSSQLTYTMDVAFDIAGVLVTATKADVNAVISGDLPNEGRATIPLDGPGTSKTISIIVTAQNGDRKTYTITINRLAPSTDSTLSNLTVSAGSLVPIFAPGTPNYSVDVSAANETITVSATKSDRNAVMSASGSVIAAAGIPAGQVTVPLGLGTSTSVAITITAQDGISTKIYTITVNRPSR